uniref:Calx-beta domain-containing protein n=1 Tax=Cyprinus carpio TaxID=7962 RepID=A0A8C1R4H9_CYPCA
MPSVLTVASLVLMLLTTSVRSESAELRFQRQTQFVVNESSRAIVRFVVERIGDAVNITALVLVSLEKHFCLIPAKNVHSVLDDSLTEPHEDFYVNLTSVRILSASLPSVDAQPRNVSQNSDATVTVCANDVVSRFLRIGPAIIHTSEDSQEGAPQQKLALRVLRSVGITGVVTQFHQEHSGTWALEGEDFVLETQTVTLLEGQNEVEVSVLILNDQEPEGQKAFFIYLSEAEGGAEIVSVPDELGFTSFAKIIIGQLFNNKDFSHLFGTEIFCHIVNVFIVAFHSFYASLLKKKSVKKELNSKILTDSVYLSPATVLMLICDRE